MIYPKEYSYAEGSRIKYIKDNIKLKDYVGIVHYRKYFDFSKLCDTSTVPNFDEVFRQYDVIVSEPNLCCMVMHYTFLHFQECIGRLIGVVLATHPEYTESVRLAYGYNKCYFRNMFVMRTEDFNEFCDFAFPVLDAFDKQLGFTCDDDVKKWVAERISYCTGFKDENYQSRIDGFLLERLFTMFVWHHFKDKRILELPVIESKAMADSYGKTANATE